jgi:hypothetical protein
MRAVVLLPFSHLIANAGREVLRFRSARTRYCKLKPPLNTTDARSIAAMTSDIPRRAKRAGRGEEGHSLLPGSPRSHSGVIVRR